jgi:hypothetical protein
MLDFELAVSRNGSNSSPERNFWCAVIREAFIDASRGNLAARDFFATEMWTTVSGVLFDQHERYAIEDAAFEAFELFQTKGMPSAKLPSTVKRYRRRESTSTRTDLTPEQQRELRNKKQLERYYARKAREREALAQTPPFAPTFEEVITYGNQATFTQVS